MTRPYGVLAVLGWLAGATALPAQTGVKLHEQDRVQFTRWDLTVVEGRVLWISEDSIVLARKSQTAVFAPNQIRTIEVFAGRRSYKLRGALIGALAGAALGAVGGAAAKQCATADAFDSSCSSGEAAAGLAAVGAVLGAGLGTLIGSSRHDVWVTMPRPWKLEPREGGTPGPRA